MSLHFGTVQVAVAAVFAALAVVFAAVFVLVAVKSRSDIPYERVQSVGYWLRKRWLALLTVVIVCVLGMSFFDLPYSSGAGTGRTVVKVTGGQFFWSLTPDRVMVGDPRPLRRHLGRRQPRLRDLRPAGTFIGSVQAMPGYHNKLDLTLDDAGRYVIRCMEFCGLDHSAMESFFTVAPRYAMAAVDAAVLHVRAAESVPVPRAAERRVGVLFVATGIAVFAVMGVFGLGCASPRRRCSMSRRAGSTA